MTDIRTRIADALRALGIEDEMRYNADRPEWVAEKLMSLPGIAIVDLPELMGDRSGVADSIRDRPMWNVGDAWAMLNHCGEIELEADGQNIYGALRNAESARELAAALLAAANAAEADQ